VAATTAIEDLVVALLITLAFAKAHFVDVEIVALSQIKE